MKCSAGVEECQVCQAKETEGYFKHNFKSLWEVNPRGKLAFFTFIALFFLVFGWWGIPFALAITFVGSMIGDHDMWDLDS